MDRKHIKASDLVKFYELKPHQEGGYYKRTYESSEYIKKDALPERYPADRRFSTAIYYLLENGHKSAFHRLKSTECWHFYYGETLLIHIIYPDGRLEIVKLGHNFWDNEQFQYHIPQGCWLSAMPAESSEFSFVGCTLAPGFEFEDFELARADDLVALYPQHENIIRKFSIM